MAPPSISTSGEAVLGRLMLAFAGTSLPGPMARRLAERPAAGVTLFRPLNVTDASQLRALTDEIQAARPDGTAFVVAIDHEGGQLIGLGPDATPFAGNMALGAADDPRLTRRVAGAIGRELRAVGVNLNHAPVADLATQPRNPALGIRCFGDDPGAVAAHVAATVLGLADAGVASTLKHFPGGGETTGDPHHALPVIQADRSRFDAVELIPFRAGIRAGARVVMSGHPAVPGLTGDPALPATLSATVLGELLRDELGFDGVTISDALDMGALPQGNGLPAGAVAALAAGQDLLLLAAAPDAQERIETALLDAARRGTIGSVDAPAARVRTLREGLLPAAGDPSTVGCAEHRALAAELAARSVTLLRDQGGMLPLRPDPEASLGVVMPRPTDRTPADTSSTVAPALAACLRRRHERTAELLVPPAPQAPDIAAAVAWARSHDLLVVGSIDASFEPGQAELVRTLIGTGVPTVTVALRTPWDLATYPRSATHACTYSIHGPSLEALAAALWGEAPFRGRLPVAHA